jgi:chorismate mutase-like protein
MNKDEAIAALSSCRERVDAVDRRMIELLNERSRIVTEIGQIKGQARLPIYEPRREDQVYENIAAYNQGPLSSDAAKRIFERIIDEMRKLQRERMEDEAC